MLSDHGAKIVYAPGHEYWRELARALTLGLSQAEFDERMNTPAFYQLAISGVGPDDDLDDGYAYAKSITPLIAAVFRSDAEGLRILLDGGATIDGLDGNDRTPLIHATIDGQAELAGTLVRHGADLDAVDSFGFAPLHYAAQQGDAVMVELLLRADAEVDVQDAYGNTPLHKAVFSRAPERVTIMRRLIAAGADPQRSNAHGVSPEDLAQTLTDSSVPWA